MTELVATGSRFAHSQRGLLPREVWLSLGRAANELNDIGNDLGEHAEAIRQVTRQAATTTAATPSTSAAMPVVRRRR